MAHIHMYHAHSANQIPGITLYYDTVFFFNNLILLLSGGKLVNKKIICIIFSFLNGHGVAVNLFVEAWWCSALTVLQNFSQKIRGLEV